MSRKTETPSALATAEALLVQRNLRDAVRFFRIHLAHNPNDLRALLKLGICHLLNGSEQAFRNIHDRAARAMGRLAHVPADLARLWARYQSLFVKVTAAALVIGSTTLVTMAEGRTRRYSGHRYSGGVHHPTRQLLKWRLRIDKQGQVFLNQKLQAAASFREQLGSARAKFALYISIEPEDETPVSRIGSVLDMCRAAGVKEVSLGSVLVALSVLKPFPSMDAHEEHVLRVQVSSAGTIQIDGKTVTPQEFKAAIADRDRQQGGVQVDLQPDAQARYRDLKPALGVCRALGHGVGILLPNLVTTPHKVGPKH